MRALFAALLGGFQAEIAQLLRSRLFVALTIIQAVTFLFLVSLFGLTGSNAPTALISEDNGPYARAFIAKLAAAHHSFDLRFMDSASAQAALQRGSLVAVIIIPKNFSDALAHGQDITLAVDVDNIDTDMTDDIQRALPSAIVAFGQQLHLPNIRVHVNEVDLIDHDTGFIPYLVVSGLALDAFLMACILSAMAVAREFEAGTVKLLAIAPVHPLVSILGRVLATDIVATAAMIFPVAIAIFGYRIVPLHPLAMIGVILLSVAIFSCIGIALGVLLKRTLPVASLVFGLCLPLYIGSGSLEPQRFDGNLIWIIAHISPVYYAVGILEVAFHNLQVTPESVATNFAVLVGWAIVMLALASILLRTSVIEKTATRQVEEPQAREHRQRRAVLYGSWLWQRRSLLLDGNRSLLASIFLVLSLIAGGAGFAAQQDLRASALSRQQQAGLLTAADQQQEALLSNDISTFSDMLLRNDLLHTKLNDPARISANALTQEAWRKLDPERKVELIMFLYNTHLIDDDYHVIDLHGANLRGIQLTGLDLNDTDFSGADLSGANLSGVNLTFSELVATNFSGANLTGINLTGADLRSTNVSKANLTNANLTGIIGMTVDQLVSTSYSLAGATLPNGSVLPGQGNSDNDNG